MTVSFTVAYDSAVDFRFERRVPNGAWANANLSVSSGQAGGPRAAIDRTLNPQTAYCYRVIALNRFGTAGNCGLEGVRCASAAHSTRPPGHLEESRSSTTR